MDNYFLLPIPHINTRKEALLTKLSMSGNDFFDCLDAKKIGIALTSTVIGRMEIVKSTVSFCSKARRAYGYNFNNGYSKCAECTLLRKNGARYLSKETMFKFKKFTSSLFARTANAGSNGHCHFILASAWKLGRDGLGNSRRNLHRFERRIWSRIQGGTAKDGFGSAEGDASQPLPCEQGLPRFRFHTHPTKRFR